MMQNLRIPLPKHKVASSMSHNGYGSPNNWISGSNLTLRPQYGLQSAFSEIERLHHEVTDGGNPIGMDLKTRYVVKGIGKEQIIDSKILIYYDKTSGKITKVQDKWDGQLPDSSFKNVSIEQLFNPWWWVHYCEGWVWWGWSFTWDMWWWQVGTLRLRTIT